MKRAIQFGAGNIGRGFIGAVLSEAGYHVVFADVNMEVIDRINKDGAYTVHIMDVESRDVRISNISGVDSGGGEIVDEIVRAEIITTAVGLRILPFIAPAIAKGIAARRAAGVGEPLNVIACENGIRATSQLREEVYKHLSAEEAAWCDAHVGFADCSVDRIVPPVRSENPIDVVVENFYEWNVEEKSFVGGAPHIEGMNLADNLLAYIERKLFTLNTGHAITAYLGRMKGLATIDESIADPAIFAIVKEAMQQSGQALVEKFGFDRDAHFKYIDKIIGRIYPVFGAILLFSAVGVFIGLFVKGYPLLNLWDDWHGIAFDAWAVDAATGEQAAFSYGQYFDANHFIPIFFITVACGILSGFHSTQTAIISRTMKSEKQGRMTFYNMMILEGFIAMIWAAAAMGVYNLGLQEVNASLATGTVGIICRDLLGPVGGIIALLGVIVLPITSGDTALRSLRLSVSESLHIDQSSKAKRLGLSAIIFALVAVILVFAKSSPSGFNTLWRYFAWSNQTLSLFAFLGISVWMFENSKAKWVWIPLIPAAWYTFVTVTYIANAQIGFHIPWTPAYIIGVCAAVAYVGIVVWYGKKRAARLQKL